MSGRRTYVLVHGATGGSWAWWTVDSLLTRRGHRVVNAILWENLHDVILVGHRYGGMVIAGVADRIPQRIGRLVYLDAFLPESGETALQLAESIGNTHLRENSRNGFIIPVWVSDTAEIPRDVLQSLRTFTDTLRLTNPAARRLPATYILTFERGKEPDAFQRFADRARSRGWPVVRMEADHVPNRSNPEALARLLERLQ